MKTAVIKITDEQTGESREFPILDDQGLVTFFTTFFAGTRTRLGGGAVDYFTELSPALKSQNDAVVEAHRYYNT